MDVQEEIDWGARAFSMILGVSMGMSDEGKKKALKLLLEAPDSIKARVTDFDVRSKS